ncbi:urease accessory protein [Pseudovibrio denitrificans]|uniref:Urease accessory protein UreF n=1 Tax=Pseudovibrio denitrificans TaxID=258256 RepID=A0A1I6XKJ4_9HYPH|nr:urease accessory protein UreF [Pseudovibrio denitrificans]SFT38676.1 urease accessory protein [Pseudovibrio denitrificans]
MNEVAPTTALLQLMTWLSPSFPTGAFAYSHGLESAIQRELITCRSDAEEYLHDLIHTGSLWNDLVLASLSWKAATQEDIAFLCQLNELALALCPGEDRFMETTLQGDAFSKAAKPWGSEKIALQLDSADLAYPIAVATIAATNCVPLIATLAAYQHSFCANLVSVMMRLVPLGQTDGMQILADLEPHLAELSMRAATASLDDLGSTTLHGDFLAMAHEHQHTRIFRS